MSNIKPFFEVDGKTYEFIRTRTLIVKYEELMKEISPKDGGDGQEAKNLLKFQRLQSQLQESLEKFKEVKVDFYAKPTDTELRATYKIFKEEYEQAYDDLVSFEADNRSVSLAMDKSLDVWEKLLFEALIEQYGLQKKEAIVLWETHVDEIGKEQASEWIYAFYKSLFEKEEKVDPFLAKAREVEIQKAQQKSSLNKVMKR